jgi:metal-dependent hydrolase (beta-lactamase superfamily II)
MTFTIHFLPARYGDCIWLEYGTGDTLYHILIDGGTSGTKKDIKQKLSSLPNNLVFDLLVVTHIDRDHIEGILSILEEDELSIRVKDLWFNGWGHLPVDPIEALGAEQGERLSAAILKHDIPWNVAFNEAAVVVPEVGDLPVIELPGGMKLTLLSPTIAGLKKLRSKWIDEIEAAGMEPGFGLVIPETDESEEIVALGMDVPDIEALLLEPFEEDNSAANGSSIAFLAEYGGKRVLFAGDAYPTTVLNSLKRKFDTNKLNLDLVKLSHHASKGNTSPDLLQFLDCFKYVISTNGSIFHHPSQVTLARILDIKGEGVEFIFNYESEHNRCWDAVSLRDGFGYTTRYPRSGETGIMVSL